MVRNPKIYLMDEPLSNLDAQLRTQTRTQIVQWQHQLATTTVYVTHDQTEAMTMGSRIAVMNRGCLQQVATPLTVYREPANIFVAGFIGEPQMNFFPCVPTVALGRTSLVGEGFCLSLPPQFQGVPLPPRLTIGIRPEHLVLNGQDPVFQGRVEFVETLGRETLIFCATPSGPLRVRLTSECPRPDESCGFAVQAFHLFDETSGLSIKPSRLVVSE
ncbi:ABC transporter ATP-binding protein [Candidatus Cyanaurora vandensis]|uniref:ABC transporter ATP-binding protein n=2 Tax=Candidatus Cyanaurora vandensis TaxID=2714958 RepID=UPI0037BF4F03